MIPLKLFSKINYSTADQKGIQAHAVTWVLLVSCSCLGVVFKALDIS